MFIVKKDMQVFIGIQVLDISSCAMLCSSMSQVLSKTGIATDRGSLDQAYRVKAHMICQAND